MNHDPELYGNFPDEEPTGTRVVNIRLREKFDVYIGREGKGYGGYFGNPYSATDKRLISRLVVIGEFRSYFEDRLKEDVEFRKRVEGLRGKALGCFCAPAPCHGHVIVGYLEGKAPESLWVTV